VEKDSQETVATRRYTLDLRRTLKRNGVS